VEQLLGQPSRSIYCSKLSSVLEAISTLSSNIKVVVISCLSGIVGTCAEGSDPKTAIEKAMTLIGNGLFSLSTQRQHGIRIFIAPCTPRQSADFPTHNKLAMVSKEIR